MLKPNSAYVNWPIRRRDIAKTIFNMASVPHVESEKIILLVKCASGNEDFHLHNEFDRNWIILRGHCGVLAILKMAADAILRSEKVHFGDVTYIRTSFFISDRNFALIDKYGAEI